jgi:hypothetical protein
MRKRKFESLDGDAEESLDDTEESTRSPIVLDGTTESTELTTAESNGSIDSTNEAKQEIKQETGDALHALFRMTSEWGSVVLRATLSEKLRRETDRFMGIFTRDAIHTLDDWTCGGRVFIAGGAADFAYRYSMEPWDKKPITNKSSDLDFFVIRPCEHPCGILACCVKKARETFVEILEKFRCLARKFRSSYVLYSWRRSTVIVHLPGRNYQIVFCANRTAESTLADFDLPCCTIGMENDESFVMLPHYLSRPKIMHLKRTTTGVSCEGRRSTTVDRVVKYEARGYDFTFDGDETTRNEMIQSRERLRLAEQGELKEPSIFNCAVLDTSVISDSYYEGSEDSDSDTEYHNRKKNGEKNRKEETMKYIREVLHRRVSDDFDVCLSQFPFVPLHTMLVGGYSEKENDETSRANLLSRYHLVREELLRFLTKAIVDVIISDYLGPLWGRSLYATIDRRIGSFVCVVFPRDLNPFLRVPLDGFCSGGTKEKCDKIHEIVLAVSPDSEIAIQSRKFEDSIREDLVWLYPDFHCYEACTSDRHEIIAWVNEPLAGACRVSGHVSIDAVIIAQDNFRLLLSAVVLEVVMCLGEPSEPSELGEARDDYY